MRGILQALIILGAALSSYGQSYTPLSLSERLFSRDSFPDLEKFITGEFEGHPNGTDLPDNVETRFLMLGQDDETAVVNLTLIDSAGGEFDTYLHLVKDSIWKVTAFRGLAMTGFIEEVKMQLEELSEFQIDSIVNASATDTTGISFFKSREEYEFLIGNFTLTLASDNDIIEHFRKNRDEFESIRDVLLSKGLLEEGIRLQDLEDADSIQSRLAKLFINNVDNHGFYSSPSNLEFNIGGMIDNTVGYLYIQDKANVPKMNPNRIIMIREIGNGWYLFKTT